MPIFIKPKERLNSIGKTASLKKALVLNHLKDGSTTWVRSLMIKGTSLNLVSLKK